MVTLQEILGTLESLTLDRVNLWETDFILNVLLPAILGLGN